MWNWLRNKFRPSVGRGQTVPSGRPSQQSRGGHAVRGSYDAAQTTDENRRHWQWADSLSADSANSKGVRQVVRNRARYETANNGYADGIVDTLANDTIGTCPRLKLRSGNAAADQVAEKSWALWAKRVRLGKRLRTIRKSKARDGEGLAVLITNPRLRHLVKLDLRPVETEQLTTPGLLLPINPNQIDGIILDEHGNPIEYHILRQHPGGPFYTAMLEYDKVPPSHMVHIFDEDRAGQHRGMSEIMPSLPLYAHLRRFTLATINSAEKAAILSGAIKNNVPVDPDEVDAPTTGDLWEIDRGTFPILPPDCDIVSIPAEQPTTTYPQFKQEILNEIARPVSMPRNIAAGDSSNYNYSSGRLDHSTYFNAREIEQFDLAGEDCLEKIWCLWIQEAVLAVPGLEGLHEAVAAGEDIPHDWAWDQPEDIDEEKTANAAKVRLESGQSSYTREFTRMGLDAQAEMKQMADDLGMTLDEYRQLLRQKIAAGGAAKPAPQQPSQTDTQTQDGNNDGSQQSQ